MSEELKTLEGRISELEAKQTRKDGWDKAEVVFAACTPIVLAVVGYIFTTESQRTDQNLKAREQDVRKLEVDYKREKDLHDERMSTSELDLKTAELLVKRSDVYRALTPDLFGAEGPKKELALRILARVDPDSPEVLKQLIEKAPTSPSAMFARDSLADKRSEIALGFFDENKNARVNAFSNIRLNWKDDEALCALLLETLSRFKENPDRVYSVSAILKFFSTKVLQANRVSVERFFASVPVADPAWAKTAAEIELAKARLNIRLK